MSDGQKVTPPKRLPNQEHVPKHNLCSAIKDEMRVAVEGCEGWLLFTAHCQSSVLLNCSE